MNPRSDWEEIERLFHEVVDLPADERQALLASASEPVKAEVESLLDATTRRSWLRRPLIL